MCVGTGERGSVAANSSAGAGEFSGFLEKVHADLSGLEQALFIRSGEFPVFSGLQPRLGGTYGMRSL